MHDLNAIVGKTASMHKAAALRANAVVCDLPQGYSLIPITDDLERELAQYNEDVSLPFAPPVPDLSEGLLHYMLELSHDGALAFVSTAYFGGHGGQDALAIERGRLIFSPLSEGYDQAWPHSSISQALELLGVVPNVGRDAFDTVELGRHRETHRWAESAN